MGVVTPKRAVDDTTTTYQYQLDLGPKAADHNWVADGGKEIISVFPNEITGVSLDGLTLIIHTNRRLSDDDLEILVGLGQGRFA